MSKTLSSETFTSGTLTTLNLDDYPHLSPKMRELAQTWFDQYRKTIEALDAIPDPALRAQAAATLENRWKMQLFLKLSLEWGNQTYRDAYTRMAVLDGQMRDCGRSAYENINELVCPKKGETNNHFIQQLSSECPEFTEIFRKEASHFVALTYRMQFELSAYHQKWIQAEFGCYVNNIFALMAPEGGVLRDAYSWDEEVYCLRQLGGRGIAALVARSYQRALDSHVTNPLNPLFSKIRGGGNLVLIPTVVKPYGDEQIQEAKALFSEEDNLPKTEKETKAIMQSLEEEMHKAETSATLPTGS
jgi:hypothetical protein